MKKLTTTTGEKVAVSERELIWNALDLLWTKLESDEDYYLALTPRHNGIRISGEELMAFISQVRPKFA